MFPARNVNQVHENRILPFQKEERAKDLLNQLSWVAPVAVVMASLVDLVLIVLYQRFFHPWKRILATTKASKKVAYPATVTSTRDIPRCPLKRRTPVSTTRTLLGTRPCRR